MSPSSPFGDIGNATGIPTPYLGAWRPDGASEHFLDAAGTDGRLLQAYAGEHALNVSGAELTAAAAAGKDSSIVFDVHPDSGATASLTNVRSRLINVTTCSEVFAQADGLLAKCSAKGDMPVATLDAAGRRYNF